MTQGMRMIYLQEVKRYKEDENDLPECDNGPGDENDLPDMKIDMGILEMILTRMWAVEQASWGQSIQLRIVERNLGYWEIVGEDSSGKKSTGKNLAEMRKEC